jgi:hypothetical protein
VFVIVRRLMAKGWPRKDWVFLWRYSSQGPEISNRLRALEFRLIDLVLGYLGGDAPSGKATELGAASDIAPALLQGPAQINAPRTW